MRFLCLSDIHGNYEALDAVLSDATLRGFDQVLACGDLLYPGPEPLKTWKRLVEVGAVCVQGLGDRALATVDPSNLIPHSKEQEARLERLFKMHDELGELIIARLARLKQTARLPLESGHELLLVHGSPADPTEAMSQDMDDDELNALIGDEPADVIVCGASHVPFERKIGDTLIVNVGSVGDAPTAGYAHATIIDSSAFGVRVNQFEVELPEVPTANE